MNKEMREAFELIVLQDLGWNRSTLKRDKITGRYFNDKVFMMWHIFPFICKYQIEQDAKILKNEADGYIDVDRNQYLSGIVKGLNDGEEAIHNQGDK